jgi:hypothetical protein
VGIPGNETADREAYRATRNTIIEEECKLELGEYLQLAENYIDRCWQNLWDANFKDRFYHKIVPKVNRKLTLTLPKRRDETLITRLRVGKCRNNHYLFKIGKHPTGLCDICKQPDTVEHLLLNCQTQLCTELKLKFQELGLLELTETVLTDKRFYDTIFKNIKKQI